MRYFMGFIDQKWHPVFVFFITGLLCTGISIFYIPDSYEYALLSQCFIGDSPSIDCQRIDPLFRPPTLPILNAILFRGHFSGIGVLAFASLIASLTLIWIILRPLGIWVATGGWMSCCGAFLLSRYPLLADARVFCLLPMLAGCYFAVREPTKRNGFVAGLCIGIAALTRPECQITALFFFLILIVRSRRMGGFSLLGSALPIGSWIILLSLQAKRLVIAPRQWEDYLLLSWQEVPMRWALQLYGMGIWNPGPREAAQLAPPPETIPQQAPSLSAGSTWINSLIEQEYIWWLLLIPCFFYGIRNRRARIITLIFTSMLLTSLVAACWPQARDMAFPIANFLPAKLVLWIGIGAGVGALVQGFRWKAVIGGSAAIPVLFAEANLPKTIEASPTGQQMIEWIAQETPSNSKVISSYENAPIVWLAERNWEQWPTKWEKRETATHILVSNLDAFWTGSSEFNHATLTLEVAFQHHTDWLYLYTIEERP